MNEFSSSKAPQGETQQQISEARERRWYELDKELKGNEYPATPEDLERCKAELVSKYKGEAAEDDGLLTLTMRVISDPVALMSYYQNKARQVDIEAHLYAEGFTRPEN